MPVERRRNTLRPTGRSFYAALKTGPSNIPAEERAAVLPFVSRNEHRIAQGWMAASLARQTQGRPADTYGTSLDLRLEQNKPRPNPAWYGRMPQKDPKKTPSTPNAQLAPTPVPAPAKGRRSGNVIALKTAQARPEWEDWASPPRPAAIGYKAPEDHANRKYWASPEF